jgi:hypothetical protein
VVLGEEAFFEKQELMLSTVGVVDDRDEEPPEIDLDSGEELRQRCGVKVFVVVERELAGVQVDLDEVGLHALRRIFDDVENEAEVDHVGGLFLNVRRVDWVPAPGVVAEFSNRENIATVTAAVVKERFTPAELAEQGDYIRETTTL